MKIGQIKQTAQDFLGKYEKESPATYAAAEQAIGGVLILDGFVGIDNPFGGKSRPGIFGSFFGVVVGVLFLFAPMLFINASGINKLTATTQATVVGVYPTSSTSSSSGCAARAKYTVNGRQYIQTAVDSSGGYCGLVPGSTVTIHYNPNNPGVWSDSLQSLSMFMGIWDAVCAIIILASLFTFVVRLLSIIFGWKLLKSGRAHARTLPGGTDLSSLIGQIKQEFSKTVFQSAGTAGTSFMGSMLSGMQPTTPPQTAPSAPRAVPTSPAPAPVPSPAPDPVTPGQNFSPSMPPTTTPPAVTPEHDTGGSEPTPPPVQ